MSQTDPMRVFVDVPQSAAAELMHAGVPVEIRPAGGDGARVPGNDRATRPESINAQARTMRVEVDIPNARHALVPGMYVNVAFGLQPKGLVEVPAAALVFRAAARRSRRWTPAAKSNFQNVTIARDNGSLIELASGIQPGDRLVLNISSQIASGQRLPPRMPARRSTNEAPAAAAAGVHRGPRRLCGGTLVPRAQPDTPPVYGAAARTAAATRRARTAAAAAAAETPRARERRPWIWPHGGRRSMIRSSTPWSSARSSRIPTSRWH